MTSRMGLVEHGVGEQARNLSRLAALLFEGMSYDTVAYKFF